MMKKSIRIMCIVMSAILAFSLTACQEGAKGNTDIEDAAAFVAFVAEIPPAAELTLNDGAKITAAELAYAKLSAEARAFENVIEAKVVLTVARNKFNTLTTTLDPAANAFIEKANAVGIVSLDSGHALSEAFALFAGLDAAQKNLQAVKAVKADLDEKKAQYDAMLKSLGDAGVAQAFISAVEAIGTVSTSALSKGKIDYARAMYDELTPAQAAYPGVSAALTTLSAKEAQYANLKTQEAILASANQFIADVNALEQAQISPETGSQIEALKLAYDNLTDKTVAGVAEARSKLDELDNAFSTLISSTSQFKSFIADNIAGLEITFDSLQSSRDTLDAAQNLYAAFDGQQKGYVAAEYAVLEAKEKIFRSIPVGEMTISDSLKINAYSGANKDFGNHSFNATASINIGFRNYFGDPLDNSDIDIALAEGNGNGVTINAATGSIDYTFEAGVLTVHNKTINFFVDGEPMSYPISVKPPMLPVLFPVSDTTKITHGWTDANIEGCDEWRVYLYVGETAAELASVSEFSEPYHVFTIHRLRGGVAFGLSKISRELAKIELSANPGFESKTVFVKAGIQAITNMPDTRSDGWYNQYSITDAMSFTISKEDASNKLPSAPAIEMTNNQIRTLANMQFNGLWYLDFSSDVEEIRVHVYKGSAVSTDITGNSDYIGYYSLHAVRTEYRAYPSASLIHYRIPAQDGIAAVASTNAGHNNDAAFNAYTLHVNHSNNIMAKIAPSAAAGATFKFATQIIAKTSSTGIQDGDISVFVNGVWTK